MSDIDQETTFPVEYALGNIVKLKEPYDGIFSPRGKRFTFGIIVERLGTVLGRDLDGATQVSLHLYNEDGELYMGPNSIPVYVDFVSTEFEVWKVALKSGYVPELPEERR